MYLLSDGTESRRRYNSYTKKRKKRTRFLCIANKKGGNRRFLSWPIWLCIGIVFIETGTRINFRKTSEDQYLPFMKHEWKKMENKNRNEHPYKPSQTRDGNQTRTIHYRSS